MQNKNLFSFITGAIIGLVCVLIASVFDSLLIAPPLYFAVITVFLILRPNRKAPPKNPLDLHVVAISLDTTFFSNLYGDSIKRQQAYAKKLATYTLIVLNTAAGKKLRAIKKENLHMYPTNSQNRWWYVLDALKILSQIKNIHQIHVITSQDAFITGLIGVIGKHLFSLPLNVQLHSDDIISPWWRKRSLQNKIFYYVSRFVISNADTIRHDNQRKIATLRKELPHFTQRTYQVPLFIDVKSFYKKARSKKKITRLISVGRLAWEKNFPLLIRSVSHLHQLGHSLHLTIVGGGEEEEPLKKLISNLGINNLVSFTGYQSTSDVRRLLYANDVFLLASFYEGWAVVINEALAAGLPVIITDVGSAGELVIHRQSGLICQINNQSSLENAIKFAIRHPLEMSRMAAVGQRQVLAQYQPKTITQNWINCLYETATLS